MRKSTKIDRVDVRARLVVGQAFCVGDRLGLITDRRTEDAGVMLSVEYVTNGRRVQSVRASRLESVASVITAFTTRAEYDEQRRLADEWKAQRVREVKRKSREKTEAKPPAPQPCATHADLEQRVLLIESTVCKYLLGLLQASDSDGTLGKFFEEKGGIRAQ